MTVQVCGKGAKFSLYKPAEEMVYISLDNESRTKGKAAIDVVGAQTGKSIGSILQQVTYIGTLWIALEQTSQRKVQTDGPTLVYIIHMQMAIYIHSTYFVILGWMCPSRFSNLIWKGFGSLEQGACKCHEESYSLQVLLVVCAGSLTQSLPVMGIAYWGILIAWLKSVDTLADVHGGAFSH